MRKNELIAKAIELAEATPKLNKDFKENLLSLLNEYKGSGKGEKAADIIAQVKEFDGVEYAWCNKHLRYEIATNFLPGAKGREYRVCCRAAELQMAEITKLINEQNKIMLDDDATPEIAFEALKEKKLLDTLRKGSYDAEEIDLNIEGYDYTSPVYTL